MMKYIIPLSLVACVGINISQAAATTANPNPYRGGDCDPESPKAGNESTCHCHSMTSYGGNFVEVPNPFWPPGTVQVNVVHRVLCNENSEGLPTTPACSSDSQCDDPGSGHWKTWFLVPWAWGVWPFGPFIDQPCHGC